MKYYLVPNFRNDEYYTNLFNQKKLIFMALPFAAFMFLHKISYVFVLKLDSPEFIEKIEEKIIFNGNLRLS